MVTPSVRVWHRKFIYPIGGVLMRFLRLISIILLFVSHSQLAISEDFKQAVPPTTTSSAESGDAVASQAIASTSEQSNQTPPYEPLKFNIALWIGMLVGSLGSFAIFLKLHRSGRVRLDWAWPILSVIATGYVLVMGLASIYPAAYDIWSEKCFQGGYFDNERRYSETDEVSLRCANAQVDHKALGLNIAVNWARQGVAGGLANPLFPSEMKFVIWFVLFFWSAIIYFTLLLLRRRFFVR